MRHRVVIILDNDPITEKIREVYPAATPTSAHLTDDLGSARKYHNKLNAEIDSQKWAQTLRLLGVDADIQIERIVR